MVIQKQVDPNQGPKKAFKWGARHTVLVFIWLGWFLSFLDRMVITLSLPFIGKEFNIDAAAQGLILSAFFAGYALFQIPGGMLADKLGFRRMLSVGIVWWSAFTTLTGAVFSYPLLLLVRFAFGLGEAVLPGSSYKTLTTYFPSKERGTAIGIQSTANSIGNIFASITAAAIIVVLGWRAVFLVLGIPGVILGVYYWMKFKDNPADHPQMTPEDLAELQADREEEQKQLLADNKSGLSFKDIIKTPILWQMIAIWFLADIAIWGFSSWMPSYLMNVRGLSVMKTGIYGSLPYLFGAIGILLGGRAADRYRDKIKWLFVGAAALGGVFIYLLFVAPSTEMTIFYQCLANGLMCFSQGVFWTMVSDSFPASLMGSGSAAVNFGGQVAGLVAPAAMGFMIKASGGSYNAAFLLLVVSLVAAAVLALTIKKRPIA